jgi:hypothetical protein
VNSAQVGTTLLSLPLEYGTPNNSQQDRWEQDAPAADRNFCATFFATQRPEKIINSVTFANTNSIISKIIKNN